MWDSPEAAGRMKYVFGALAVVMPFVFGIAALWFDRKQGELLDMRKRGRSFSAEQRAQFVAIAAEAKGAQFNLYLASDSREARKFATEVGDAMREAGLLISGTGNASVLPTRNVVLTVLNLDKPPQAAFVLQRAFRESIHIDPPIEKFGTLLGAGFGGDGLQTVQVEIYDRPEVERD
ncbi:MAG TPA: hypothetical protein VEX43_09675 [Chthoniobacterales bacterium]|nr:hypothetical protein [Chthoniobacterales bacterium]